MTDRSRITDAIRDGKARIGDVDSATRERLATRYASTWERVEAELRFVDLELQYQRRGPWFDADGRLTEYGEWAFRQQRLESLLQLIEAEYGRTANVALDDLTVAQRQAIGIGTQTAGTMGISGNVGAALNVNAYERIVAATDPGSPLHGVLSRYGDEAKAAITNQLIDGMIQGKGMGDIVEAIRGEIGPGVPRWKLALLSRTESMRAFRGSLSTAYQAKGLEQLQWTSTLSVRTCAACLARHGNLFPVNYVMDSHPACRCVLSPYTGTSRRMTGEEWFAGQPADTQRRILGTDAALDAYRAGDVTLADFVGVRQSQVWGRSIYQRSTRDVLGRAA